MDDEEEERGRNQESTFKYCAGNIQNTDVQIIFFLSWNLSGSGMGLWVKAELI